MFIIRPAILLAGAGLAAAWTISSNCSSAVLSVAASPQATCLDVALLTPLLLSNTSTTSIIPTVNTWLSGMCPQGPCTNETLQTVVTNITTGCSTDLAAIGYPITNVSAIVAFVQSTYPTARKVACYKDTSVNELCVTEVLTGIQSSTTTLSVNNVVGLITKVVSGQNVTIAQNVTCSNCSKAAYTTIDQNFPTFVSKYESYFQSECGSSFTDGQMPSSIQETTSNSTSSPTSGASSLSVSNLGVGVAMLVAVSSAFATFA